MFWSEKMSKNNSWPCKDIFLLFLGCSSSTFLREPKYHLMFVHQTQNDLVNLQRATVQANWKDGRTATSWASFGAWFEHQRILQCFELARITRYNTTFSISNPKHDSSSFQNVTAKGALFGIVNSCPLIHRCSYHSCRLHFLWYIYIHIQLYIIYIYVYIILQLHITEFVKKRQKRFVSAALQGKAFQRMNTGRPGVQNVLCMIACTAILR